MKAHKLVFACIAMLISVAAFSQTDTTKKDTTRKDTTRKDSLIQGQQASAAAATIQQSEPSAAQKKFPTPNAGRNYIPVLGSFQSAQADAENKSITVTSDESNAGKIWIEGLTGGKFYALLKALPGTYKIPAQKQEDKSIAEGTVRYDEATKSINVCLGCGYDKAVTETSPATEEAVTVKDSKTAKNAKTAKGVKPVKAQTIINFSGTKVENGTASVSQ